MFPTVAPCRFGAKLFVSHDGMNAKKRAANGSMLFSTEVEKALNESAMWKVLGSDKLTPNHSVDFRQEERDDTWLPPNLSGNPDFDYVVRVYKNSRWDQPLTKLSFPIERVDRRPEDAIHERIVRREVIQQIIGVIAQALAGVVDRHATQTNQQVALVPKP